MVHREGGVFVHAAHAQLAAFIEMRNEFARPTNARTEKQANYALVTGSEEAWRGRDGAA